MGSDHDYEELHIDISVGILYRKITNGRVVCTN
jgi:hypothetical protein